MVKFVIWIVIIMSVMFLFWKYMSCMLLICGKEGYRIEELFDGSRVWWEVCMIYK